MATKCGIAVIGTGSIGQRHLSVLRGIDSVRPIAVPRRPERVCELEQAGYTAVNSLDHAVSLGSTLCIVATDTGRHIEDSLEAVKKGYHLLVEKPLSTDAFEAKRLCAQVEKAKRKMFVACLLRFSNSLNKFRELLSDIGTVHAVRIECQTYLPGWRPTRDYLKSYSARAEEGGVLRDLIHEIDYAGWLFGWPTTLQARVRNLGRLGIAAEEAADLWWETANKTLVSIRIDYLSKPTRRRMAAFGQRGTLEWDGVENRVFLHIEEEPLKVAVLPQTKDEMLLAQSLAFMNAVQGTDDPLLATGWDGVRALAVCDAARRASESRHDEKVEYT